MPRLSVGDLIEHVAKDGTRQVFAVQTDADVIMDIPKVADADVLASLDLSIVADSRHQLCPCCGQPKGHR